MKTNKLPQLVWTDSQAAGSQSQQYNQPSRPLNIDYVSRDTLKQTGHASNDASYESELSQAIADNNKAQKATVSGMPYVEKAINVDDSYKKASNITSHSVKLDYSSNEFVNSVEPFKPMQDSQLHHLDGEPFDGNSNGEVSLGSATEHSFVKKTTNKLVTDKIDKKNTDEKVPKIPERVFMNGLIKHTGIALAIIIPLAAFSAYAAPSVAPSSTIAVEPSAIIHSAASVPTTVASVDLTQYAGTWYEIGRLPMYFQRNCARDVTATYTPKTSGSGIVVTNKCTDANGKGIVADGLAKSVDDTGSKLKVTFLPSWIRWLPVGRADYWVLARDADYKTALVGTPYKDYLWLLARTPNISQETYAKYRQIAQQQGYDLKEFNLTPQSGQTVNLVP